MVVDGGEMQEAKLLRTFVIRTARSRVAPRSLMLNHRAARGSANRSS